MLTIEMYFNAAIEKQDLFKQEATSLIENITFLTPSEIDNRCQKIAMLYDSLIADKDHLIVLMEFSGKEILDTPYIGEFQRALGKSIDTCDALNEELHSYKNNLILD